MRVLKEMCVKLLLCGMEATFTCPRLCSVAISLA